MSGIGQRGFGGPQLLLLAALLTAAAGCPSDRHPRHEHGGEEGLAHDHEEGLVRLTPEQQANAGIETGQAELRALPFVLRTTARVDFDERRLAHVSPRIRGRVAEVRAELGDDVEAGEILAMGDSVELGKARARYLAAKAEAELARKTLSRERRLQEQRISSEQAVIEARAGWRMAVAEREAEAEHLRLLGLTDAQIEGIRYGDPEAPLFPLTAPIAGRVVEKHLTLGELVTPERNVFTIADLGHLWIWVDVFETDLARVHRGDEVHVVADAYPERAFEGEVTYVRDQVDPATRTARARIDVENPEGLLKPGMFAQVRLVDPHGPSGGPGQAVERLAVPRSAVVRDGPDHVVFVPKGGRSYERRPVETGVETGEHVEIVRGLEAGDTVVVEGAFLLKSQAARHRMGGGHSH